MTYYITRDKGGLRAIPIKGAQFEIGPSTWNGPSDDSTLTVKLPGGKIEVAFRGKLKECEAELGKCLLGVTVGVGFVLAGVQKKEFLKILAKADVDMWTTSEDFVGPFYIDITKRITPSDTILS